MPSFQPDPAGHAATIKVSVVITVATLRMELALFLKHSYNKLPTKKHDFHHKFVPEAAQLSLKLFHLGAHITKLSLVVHVLDLTRGRVIRARKRQGYVSGLVSDSHYRPQSSSSTDGRTQAINTTRNKTKHKREAQEPFPVLTVISRQRCGWCKINHIGVVGLCMDYIEQRAHLVDGNHSIVLTLPASTIPPNETFAASRFWTSVPKLCALRGGVTAAWGR